MIDYTSYIDNYRQEKEALKKTAVLKIYCDGSQRDDILTAGIYVLHSDGSYEVYAETLSEKMTIQEAEAHAIHMALKYLKKHHSTSCIIYTEINEFLQAHMFTVVLNRKNAVQIPSPYDKTACRYKTMWDDYRSIYQKNKHVVLEKVNSKRNPAHKVAYEKMLDAYFLTNRNKHDADYCEQMNMPKWKKWVVRLCYAMIHRIIR